jgi:hypothetical protein
MSTYFNNIKIKLSTPPTMGLCHKKVMSWAEYGGMKQGGLHHTSIPQHTLAYGSREASPWRVRQGEGRER